MVYCIKTDGCVGPIGYGSIGYKVISIKPINFIQMFFSLLLLDKFDRNYFKYYGFIRVYFNISKTSPYYVYTYLVNTKHLYDTAATKYFKQILGVELRDKKINALVYG